MGPYHYVQISFMIKFDKEIFSSD